MRFTKKLALAWPAIVLTYLFSWLAVCSGSMFKIAGFFVSRARIKKRARLCDRPSFSETQDLIQKNIVKTVLYVSKIRVFNKYILMPGCLKNCLCTSMMLSFFAIEHRFCTGVLCMPNTLNPKKFEFHSWIKVNGINIMDPKSSAEYCKLYYAVM